MVPEEERRGGPRNPHDVLLVVIAEVQGVHMTDKENAAGDLRGGGGRPPEGRPVLRPRHRRQALQRPPPRSQRSASRAPSAAAARVPEPGRADRPPAPPGPGP